MLTNRRNVISAGPFPHLIFITNSYQNSFVTNESFLLNIPVAGLVDSNENPLNYTFPIPCNSKSFDSIFFFYLLIYKLKKYSRFEAKYMFISNLSNNRSLFRKKKYLLRFCLLGGGITQG